MLVCTFVFLFFLSCGRKPQVESSELILKAHQQGKIDMESYLLGRIRAIFSPKKLPGKFRSEIKPKFTRELTHLLIEVQRNWKQLSEKAQDELKTLYARPTENLDSGPFPPDTINLAYSTQEESPFDTPHFRIHYVNTTSDAPDLTDMGGVSGVPDYVEKVGELFEEVYDFEMTEMGYQAPLPDQGLGGDDRFDVYLKDIDILGYIGIAIPENANAGSPSYGYMYLDNDFANYLASGQANFPIEVEIKATAAHEFHHCVQFGYESLPDIWLAEGTSIWIENEILPEYNSHLTYGRVFDSPGTPLNCSNDTHWTHWYSRWIWNKFLAERYGQDIIRKIWEAYANVDALLALKKGLQVYQTNLDDAFADYTARNYTRVRRYAFSLQIGEPYNEGAGYPEMTIENGDNPHSSYPVPAETLSLNRLSAQYMKFIPASSLQGNTLKIQYNGPNDLSNTGTVILQTRDGRKVDRSVKLNNNHDGSVLISGFGTTVRSYADVESAILIMNNTTGTNDGLSFSYSAKTVSGPDPQITPWGISWGYKKPFYKTPDIWVDNDQDGIPDEKGEPSVGRGNTLVARIRNLGDAPVPNVRVKFFYAPATIGKPAFKLIGYMDTTLTVGQEKVVPIDWDLTNLLDNNNGAWPRPIKDFDHFCVKVVLESSADINPKNNQAQNNFVNVAYFPSLRPSPGFQPVVLKLLLVNSTSIAQEATMVSDPPLPLVLLRFSLPPSNPLIVRLAPNEVKYVEVRFSPHPLEPRGPPPRPLVVNVTMRMGNKTIGGISYRFVRGNTP